jgi:hypothetical protein
MTSEPQFRRLLPGARTAMVVLFGGLGLWQRNEMLPDFGMGQASGKTGAQLFR